MASNVTHHLEPAVRHAVAAASEHAATSAHAGGIPELPNFVTLLSERWQAHPVVAFLHHWENLVFSLVVALGLCWVAWRYARKPATIPHGRQNFIELLVEHLDQFVQSVLGPSGRRHVPFIGTLFIYIWLMNLSGLIPGMKSSTSVLNTTLGLVVAVFCYIQWERIRTLGFFNYVHHMAGSPTFEDVKASPWPLKCLLVPIKLFVMVILFVLECIGEFVKPISLSLRLGFNVLAEDVLLAVMVSLGIAFGAFLHLPQWLPLPLQIFVIPLVLIFSTVQALVFSLLSAVFIGLMAPHEERHDAHPEAHTT